MTQGQRKWHVVIWLVLVPLALVGLVLAVAWRPAEPVQDGALPGVGEVETDSDQKPGAVGRDEEASP